VIDEGGKDAIYLHQALSVEGEPDIKQGRSGSWAKQMAATAGLSEAGLAAGEFIDQALR